MKKTVLAMALTIATCGFANATASPDNEETVAVECTASDDYKEVSLEDLNEAVQSAINAYTEDYTVKSIAYDEETKMTKVTLVSKADKSEKEVVLNDEGKE